MKKKAIAVLLTASILIGALSITPFAGKTIPYQDAYDGQKSIDIVTLAKEMGGEVKQLEEGGIHIYLNNTSIYIYDKGNCIFVNGKPIPLKTEKAKDYDTGEEFNFPLSVPTEKDKNGSFLIPAGIIEEHLGIKGDKDGIKIPDKDVKPEKPDENKPDTGNGNKPDTGNGNKPDTGNDNKPDTGGGDNKPQPPKPEPPKPEPPKPIPPKPEPPKPIPPKPIPPKPEPPKPEPPKPEPPKPSGMSPKQIEAQLPGLGLSFSSEDSGNGINVYLGNNLRVAISSRVTLNVARLTGSNQGAIKSVLNMALPTGGNEIYGIISKPCSSQTLTKDGKTVSIVVSHGRISITINY